MGGPGVEVAAADGLGELVAGDERRGRAGALLRGGRGMRRGEADAEADRGAAAVERELEDEDEAVGARRGASARVTRVGA